MIEIFLKGEPPRATAQEQKTAVRNGRVIKYDPEHLKAAKRKIAFALAQHVPDKPLNGALKLEVTWAFKCKPSYDGKPKITRPDTDNLDKGLKDIMTKLGFWHDDAQVTDERIRKIWSVNPGISIKIQKDEGFSRCETCVQDCADCIYEID